MIARCLDQLTELQRCDGGLHRAFGKAGFSGEHAETGFDRLPALADSPAGKIKIEEECRRLLIMSDDIAHEHIQDVIIDGHGLVEARHDYDYF